MILLLSLRKLEMRNMNIGSFVGKLLIVEREWVIGRMAVILVRQPIGV